jgi:hypothetical protein
MDPESAIFGRLQFDFSNDVANGEPCLRCRAQISAEREVDFAPDLGRGAMRSRTWTYAVHRPTEFRGGVDSASVVGISWSLLTGMKKRPASRLAGLSLINAIAS